MKNKKIKTTQSRSTLPFYKKRSFITLSAFDKFLLIGGTALIILNGLWFLYLFVMSLIVVTI